MKLIQDASAETTMGSLTGANGAMGQDGSLISVAIPFIFIFVVFYFLILRPQQRKFKLHQAMVTAIRRGDKVVTNGGIMGKVTKVEDDGVLQIEIAENVVIKVVSSAISTVVGTDKPVNDNATESRATKSKKKA